MAARMSFYDYLEWNRRIYEDMARLGHITTDARDAMIEQADAIEADYARRTEALEAAAKAAMARNEVLTRLIDGLPETHRRRIAREYMEAARG